MSKARFPLVLPAALVLCIAAIAQAQPRELGERDLPEPARNALLHRWRQATLVPVGPARQVNGTRIYTIQVRSDRGEALAVITDNGDLISATYPAATAEDLPEPARQVIDTLFARPPRDVARIDQFTYLVDITSDGRQLRAEIDPVGRLRQLLTKKDLRDEDPGYFQHASDEDARSLSAALDRLFNRPKIRDVFRYPEADGFFVVDLSTENEPRVRVTLNTQGQIACYRVGVERDKTPRPVQDAIGSLFRNGRVQRIWRNQTTGYRVNQPLRGDEDALVLTILPTGEIERANTRSAREEEFNWDRDRPRFMDNRPWQGDRFDDPRPDRVEPRQRGQ